MSDPEAFLESVVAASKPVAIRMALARSRTVLEPVLAKQSLRWEDALPALELIALFSVGYDKVDIDHARSKGIRVTNTPDVLTDDVADLAVGLLYATVRNIAANDRLVRSGGWARRT